MNKTLVCALLFSIIVIGGCKKPDNTSPNAALVAFINGCAGTTGIDAKANGTTVGGAANIPFLGNSGYKSVIAGNVTLSYFLTNVGTPVASDTVQLTAGAHYTAFCSGLLTSPAFLLTTDDVSPPSSSSAKIRFVNLSKDNISVTAGTTTATIATGVGPLKASDFYSITAGSYDLKASDPTNVGTSVTTGIKQLAAGKIYSLVMTGTLSGTGQSALQITLIEDY